MTEEVSTVVDLNGEYRFKVDSKGRMSLPAKFRKALSNDLVVTLSPDSECVYVFETPSFNRWVTQLFEDRFGGYSASNREHSRLRTALKARAFDVQVDGAGRIMLPADQRDAVSIDKEVVIVGNTGYFEVWDAARYDAMASEVDLSLLFS
ncbi:division/cell wall cluster transcriptional repressor MraZ [Eggerthellaceae bacterium zg-1084]|uniref:Transcriptional regulator MraZ n=1 Tax=Berryella wangjianweii TaxID=2734634 RepID=A0A6M8J2S3_9ACTN|nr:division/cell wall cluster transcriptional repressor MraZ [Berryella wangjianweii]NPD31456.1 division/cell wall cluster transcriptional repressor MraZ [Berryella wangjianweii]NPD33044.1 division/cell wall cluster transcriptional repressor MraZ [Eggerthellaceae bacterium zg-997]QKF07917.1 division/cell wall cluster transcriptional repressor MraZ [Berryella wangjianweii]